MLFWFLWTVDAIVALIVFGFFVVGLSDKSVSEKNMGLWMIMLLIPAVVLAGSWWLKNHNHNVLAKSLLAIMAVPALCYALFLLLF